MGPTWRASSFTHRLRNAAAAGSAAVMPDMPAMELPALEAVDQLRPAFASTGWEAATDAAAEACGSTADGAGAGTDSAGPRAALRARMGGAFSSAARSLFAATRIATVANETFRDDA